MNQKQFLLELEQTCKIKKPLFLDTGDSWGLLDSALKYAKDLTNLPVIGRYRLTPDNSEVSELWFDLEKPEDEPFNKLATLAVETVKLIKTFGIPQSYIYCKLSGRGLHVQVFISGLRNTKQLLLLAKVIHQKLPMSKKHSLGSDARCLVPHQKIREFGAKNDEHYATLISIKELRESRRKKKYPTNKKVEDVVYPKIKIFECTKQLINRIHELQGEFELLKEREAYGTEVDYNKDGEIENLYKCPTIKGLAEKAKTERHLTHAERLAVCQTFICFGKAGQEEIHKILSTCVDYNQEYTQWVIEDNKKRGYRPFSCQWIKDHVGCPESCKGSGGKSPFKFAWGPIPLKSILDEYAKLLILHPDDEVVIEVCLAVMLDTKLAGDLAWLFVIAPPSSGKTVIINSLYHPSWAVKKDSITSKSFISGKTVKDKYTKQDKLVEGLLPKCDNKTLLIKDLTTQLMQGEEQRNAIFGQLRSIFDEEYDVAFGSIDSDLIPESWKHVRMGLLAGCTPFIDRYSTLNVILGERFLKIRLQEPDRRKATLHAFRLAHTYKKKAKILNKKVTRFLANIPIPEKDPDPPQSPFDEQLVNLAEMVVLTRRPVTTKQSTVGLKEYEYEDQAELATRLVQQLCRLGNMLALVRNGNTKWDQKIIQALERVAFDTLIPSRASLVKYLYKQKEPVNQTKISQDLHWHHSRVRNHIKKLMFINVVKDDGQENYVLDPEIRKCLNNFYIRASTDPSSTPYDSDRSSNTQNTHPTLLREYADVKKGDKDVVKR